MSVMAPQIANLTIVYLTVYSGTDERKHQTSASLAFVRGKGQENGPIWWRHRVLNRFDKNMKIYVDLI